MLKQPNFFHSQPSTLAKFYLSATFGLSFMISSAASTRSSTFYAYLIAKVGNRNLKVVVRAEILPRDFLQTLVNYYLSLTVAKFKV